MQKARCQGHKPLQQVVSVWFQFYFTPLLGYFSPFLHSTGSLSVSWEYLALRGGPPQIPNRILVSRPTQDSTKYKKLTRLGFHRSTAELIQFGSGSFSIAI